MNHLSDPEPWIPEYDVTQVAIHGQEWPLLLVKKWETRKVAGDYERRFVESRWYVAKEG